VLRSISDSRIPSKICNSVNVYLNRYLHACASLESKASNKLRLYRTGMHGLHQQTNKTCSVCCEGRRTWANIHVVRMDNSPKLQLGRYGLRQVYACTA
jgi:hypothetical protein